jgi:hypothetical protein
MPRGSRSTRRRGLSWLQITVWVVTALVALSMVLALLPLTR